MIPIGARRVHPLPAGGPRAVRFAARDERHHHADTVRRGGYSRPARKGRSTILEVLFVAGTDLSLADHMPIGEFVCTRRVTVVWLSCGVFVAPREVHWRSVLVGLVLPIGGAADVWIRPPGHMRRERRYGREARARRRSFPGDGENSVPADRFQCARDSCAPEKVLGSEEIASDQVLRVRRVSLGCDAGAVWVRFRCARR